MAAGFVMAVAGWFTSDSGGPGGALMVLGIVVLAAGVVWQAVARQRVRSSQEDSRPPQP